MNTSAPDPLAASLQRATSLIDRGQAGEAIRLLREVTREQPDNVAALHLLGIAQRRGGRLDEALRLQQSLTEREPEFASAWQEIGICHSTAGRVEDAIAAFRRATAIDSRLVNSWKFLGDLAAGQGDTDAAIEAYRQCPTESAGDPLLARARELLQAGRPGRADPVLQAFLERNGPHAEALHLRAQAAVRLGAVTDTLVLLEQALQADRDFVPARFDYVNLLSRRQRYAEALREADRLLAADPGRTPFHLLKAALLDRSGQYAEAIGMLENLLETDPSQAHVWTGLAMLQRTLGRRAEAVNSLHKAIDAQPDRGEAWYLLADLKVYDFSDAQVRAMRASVDRAPPGSDDEIHFCFALGRALEGREDWDGAFAYYARGNRVQQQRARFDPDGYVAHVGGLKQHTEPALFERLDAAGVPDAAPIFIVGLPRSGSTLVEQVLTAHSRVDGTMELPILATLVKELNYRRRKAGQAVYPQALADLSTAECRDLGTEYLERARILRGDAPYFVDKMPNNFEHVALIRLALPNARVIDVRREPMANGFSAFRQLFQTGQDWSCDLTHIGRYTNAYVDLMEHWDALLPGFVHRVHYEDLIESPEREIGRLLTFLGLPMEPACLAPQRNPRPVRTASSEQVRQPLYRHALTHWKHFEKHLEPLREALKTGKGGTAAEQEAG